MNANSLKNSSETQDPSDSRPFLILLRALCDARLAEEITAEEFLDVAKILCASAERAAPVLVRVLDRLGILRPGSADELERNC